MKTPWIAILLAGGLVTVLPAGAEVTVTDAWIRGTVATQKATGAFMKLKSTENARLVAATSPAANIVEVHEMAMKDNIMTMRAVDAIELPAGKTVELKPGGYHVMLIDLVKPLAAGDKVPVQLTVVGKDGKKATVEVKAEVRAAGGGAMKH